MAYGLLLGFLGWYLPHSKHVSHIIIKSACILLEIFYVYPPQSSLTLFRFMLLCGGGVFSIFGSLRAELSGAGALGTLTLAFVVAVSWRKQTEPGKEVSLPSMKKILRSCSSLFSFQMPVSAVFSSLWVIFQPVLFGLIGAEVSVDALQPQTVGQYLWNSHMQCRIALLPISTCTGVCGFSVGLGLAVLFIGLALRVVVSFFAVFGLNFSLKEKFFIPFAWLPKATVQVHPLLQTKRFSMV